METLEILSLSDLVRLSLPLTGAASLRSPEPFPHPPKKLKPLSPPRGIPFLLPNPNPKPNSFTPIHPPVLLVGTVDLPSAAISSATDCRFASRDHCLSFSDGSSTLCCAILDFDPIVLRRKIHVLAWNFLPFICAKVGFLEVIRWRLAPSEVVASDCDPFLSVLPPDGGPLSARVNVFGVLKSVSPVFMVPLASQNRENCGESVGFLTEIATCKCKVCRCSILARDLESRLREKGDHSFDEKVFVYFVKPTSLWRPVLVKMIGKVIVLCGLKKKMVCVGGGQSYSMFLPTEKTLVSMSRLPVGLSVRRLPTTIRSDPGAYCGVISGVYMQGLVVELDQNVWLMVTDPRIVQQHSLRVGALVRVMNSHIICAEYSWTKILLLGTSCGTHVDVISFSSSDTRCHFRNQNGSLLEEFIESLTLSARFWYGSRYKGVASSILLETETFKYYIHRDDFGIKKLSHILTQNISQQRGIFMEFCSHCESTSRTDCNLVLLKLVVPISLFVSKCEALLVSSTSKRAGAWSIKRKDYFNPFSLAETSCGLIRRIIPSEEVGCVLIGTLKICPSSGRLQLVDATGGVDVVIPDLPSEISVHNIYEVKGYKVVLEGLPTQMGALRHHSDSLLSCRNIFERIPYKRVLNQIGVYVYFSIGNSSCLNTSFHPSSLIRDDHHRISNNKFHLLLVTHKFPDSGRFHRDSGISNGFMYAEAVVLPYILIIPRADDYEQLPRDLGNKIACSFTFTNANHQLSSQSGYICNSEGNTIDRQRPYRVLLEFKSDCSYRFQLLLLGAYYSISCPRKGHGCSIKSCQDFRFGKALVTPESILWRISFAFGDSTPISQLSANQPFGISSSSLENGSLGTSHQNEIGFQLDQRKMHEISDVHLHFLPEAGKLGQKEGNPVNDYFFRFIRSLTSYGSVLSVSACIKTMMDTFVGVSEADNPECTKLMLGNLISLRGNIEHLHTYHCKSTSVCSADVVNFVDSSACNICVHLYDDLQMVRIRGTIRECAYPVGMGPGANATFHRVLMTWSSQWQELMLTPVTFVVINSVNEIDSGQIRERLVTDSSMDIQDGSFNFRSFSLIPELVQRQEPKLIRLNCRVLAIHLLVLQERSQYSVKSNPIGNIKIPLVDIPFVGLVIDDGSSLSCCWANASRAVTLLKLQATANGTFFGCRKSKRVESKSSHVTLGYHLENTLKRHHRVVVQSHGEITDPSSIEYTFSVDSHNALSYSEKCFLKFIMLNACCGTNFAVVGNTMDCHVLQRLRLELLGLHVPILSMENIWVKEVENIDPVDEARSILQELSKPK